MIAWTSKYASTLDLRASAPAYAEASRRQAFLSAQRAHNIICWYRKEHFPK
jgi:hypothetical protein